MERHHGEGKTPAPTINGALIQPEIRAPAGHNLAPVRLNPGQQRRARHALGHHLTRIRSPTPRCNAPVALKDQLVE